MAAGRPAELATGGGAGGAGAPRVSGGCDGPRVRLDVFLPRPARGEVVFTAEAHARAAAGQPYRFAVFGDCGAGTAKEKAVAYQAHRARPDLLLIAGDIVYTRGRISEYREKFWPVYDADVASPAVGAPLLRSTLVVAAPGNHDTAGRDLGQYPDGLAYFYCWDQPKNGPIGPEGGPPAPLLLGPAANRAAFREAAGPAYPRMANFSFDYGGAHWTVLDSNPYVDWTDPSLRAWVERDLDAAKDATWRFVAMHHPPFNSSHAHFGDQRMRRVGRRLRGGPGRHRLGRARPQLSADVPLDLPGRSQARRQAAQSAREDPRPMDARHRLRRPRHTQARGIIYVTTGAGGANLYNPEQDDDPPSWQPFTCRLISRVNSLTIADVDGPTLTVRQVAADGRELDRFVVTK